MSRVLFVSKPVVPPFHDGTKCLVRDVATRLTRVAPMVMAERGAPRLDGPGEVTLCSVYGHGGGFTPKFTDNARAAAWLAVASRADLWHFVFAPNRRTSQVAQALSALRRVPTLQTVASPPREFRDVNSLLFGDIVVAQSDWTATQFADAAEREGVRLPRLEVIPPPVGPVAPRTDAARAELRAQLGIAESARLFVYPGDLEVSCGARVVADVAKTLARDVPDAVVVFAYRNKTQQAPIVAAALERELKGLPVRFTCQLPDVLVLVSDAEAVLFPVDDLHGKVDLPIVLLEAMALGVPVIALDHGPLAELQGPLLVSRADAASFVDAAQRVAHDAELRGKIVAEQHAAISTRYGADVVARRYETLYLDLLKGNAA